LNDFNETQALWTPSETCRRKGKRDATESGKGGALEGEKGLVMGMGRSGDSGGIVERCGT